MGIFLLDALERAAGRDGDLTVLSGDTASSVTWADLHRRSRALAGWLQARGIGRGSAVGLLGSTSIPIVTAVRAAWLAGASVTVLTPPLSLDLAAVTEACRSAARAARLDAVVICSPFEGLTPALTNGLAGRGVDTIQLSDADLACAIGGGSPYAAPVLDPSDTALRQFTSGSTGEPRAVRISHGNLAANLVAMAAASRHEDNHDVMLSWLPLFHDMGLIGYLTLPMVCGACRLVLSSPEDFLARPTSWLRQISRFRATATAAPNFAYGLAGRLLRTDDELDLSSLRYAICGGEPIDPDAIEAFAGRAAAVGFRSEALVPAYGMAEATLAVSLGPPGRGLHTELFDADALALGQVAGARPGRPTRRLPLLGPPLSGMEVRVVDVDSGQERGVREPGELWIKGASVASSYVDHTAGLTSDGWLPTGDVGFLTGGEIVISGRRKEIVIVAGRNIAPHDVERAASTVTGVRAGRVAAFRGPDRPGAETLVVALEARAAHEGLPAAVSAAVAERVGVRPRDVLVLPPGTLPKTTSGKMRRTEARRRYLAGELPTTTRS